MFEKAETFAVKQDENSYGLRTCRFVAVYFPVTGSFINDGIHPYRAVVLYVYFPKAGAPYCLC